MSIYRSDTEVSPTGDEASKRTSPLRLDVLFPHDFSDLAEIGNLAFPLTSTDQGRSLGDIISPAPIFLQYLDATESVVLLASTLLY